ncbi:MAG: ABC transporter permease [Coriobacteriia bacterium]|nr:ABC transporter permease [Coriobacteriia bacterium]MBS5478527.1 ABC transporter permease [Coriobacteriia bacterium]
MSKDSKKKATELAPGEQPKKWTRFDAAWLAFRKDKTAVVSITLLAIIIVACLIAPLLPLNPNATDVVNRLSGPSLRHLFGTDELGRDYLARVLYGGRVSLLVGTLAMLTSLVIGIVVGTVAGLCGGIVDALLMRLVDILSSIPWMVLVMVVSIFLKPGITSIILVIGLFSWMEIARLVRAETQSIKERDFVQYARLCGVSTPRVIARHIIPSALPTIITASTTSLAGAIMTESSLSFLGVGVQQPMSSWGSLLQAAQTTMQNDIYMAIIPGLLIVIVIFAFNKFGNVMRVFADPQVMSGERGQD